MKPYNVICTGSNIGSSMRKHFRKHSKNHHWDTIEKQEFCKASMSNSGVRQYLKRKLGEEIEEEDDDYISYW